VIIFLIAQNFNIVSVALQYFLEREGYVVEIAVDIMDDLKNQRKRKGLILIAKLDLHAKDLTPGIISQFRKLTSEMHTTVIGVSNSDFNDQIRALFKNYGAKYIIKYPFNISGLLEIVKENFLLKKEFKR